MNTKRQQERKRWSSLLQAVDALQAVIWREPVACTAQRRPRIAVLQKAAAYISLLTEVVEGNLPHQLLRDVADYVAAVGPHGSRDLRAQQLRELLRCYEEEKRRRGGRDQDSFAVPFAHLVCPTPLEASSTMTEELCVFHYDVSEMSTLEETLLELSSYASFSYDLLHSLKQETLRV